MSNEHRALPTSYRLIGGALIDLERRFGIHGYITPSAFKEFRCSVATISVEVLESYLEDLLDNASEDSYLFIEIPRQKRWAEFVALGGMSGAIAVGLMLSSSGASMVQSFLATIICAAPFAYLWHQSSRRGAVRRMFFGHVISHEIARRRGTYRDEQGRPLTPAKAIKSLLGKDVPSRAEGAARLINH